MADLINQWHGVARFLAVFGLGLAVAFTIKAVVFRVLRRLAEQTESTLDDEMLDGLNWPARLIVLFSALRWAVANLEPRDMPPGAATWLENLMAILIWIAVTVALSRVAITGLVYWFRKQPDGREVTTLTRTAVTMVCSIPAVLGLLNTFEVNLAPALTALGVGGIAVSLALKDTLANLFSGFYVSLAGNLRKGDYIRIDGGYEGWVEDIRWRITTIRTMGQNLIVIPNSKLSEAVVTNFSQPVKPLAVAIPLNVSYSTDIDRFEQIVMEEVHRSIGSIEGLLEEPAPVLRLNPGFGDVGLSFTLFVHAAQFEQQFAVTDLLRRRLLKRFRQEGINIPFQLKTVEISSAKPSPG
ncbi:MAG: mechanosensitive ion channel family protein [Bryobacteraceae bacterium]|nr:mechanosensitive ion channel family protein [Bryobacteraceae bacterium]